MESRCFMVNDVGKRRFKKRNRHCEPACRQTGPVLAGCGNPLQLMNGVLL